jgi:DNA-binding SARP family transcriptional activator/ABC-type glycerol-3-phosphate transport system substrate-binding protein/class 3 adenylate cyclase
VEFRVLGALEVLDDGDCRIPLGAGKQRAVLALLLLHANEVVPTERLIDEVWGESPPETARKAVQVYITRLRKALGPKRIRTRDPGYVLELESSELDLHRFEARVRQARKLRENGDQAGAGIVLREALALWRGPPLADFAHEPFAQTEIPRLEEQRLEALEERIDSDLALGHGGDLVGEIEVLIAKHPFRERLRGQLMLALYRDGRQADALGVYQETRKLLVDELGIEPSPALQRLEGAILRQEPALETILEEPAPAAQAVELDMPTGTITFLFTDIEGSTRLLKQLRSGYDAVLAAHQQILRGSFQANGGREVDMIGESFFVAFSRAGDAVASAVSAQRALAAHTWPDGMQVRVRMGLHSGEPRAAGERYVGFGVHRAARIGTVGHGGQILLSSATRELVEDELPPETRLRELGAYELKDVDRPEQLFQVEAGGLPHEFPPLKARRVTRRRRLRLALVVATVAGVAAAASIAILRSNDNEPAVGSARNPITILSLPWEFSEKTAFVKVLKAFETETGHKTQLEQTPNFLPRMRTLIAAGNPPMLAMIPTPGILADLAREGALEPLAPLGVSNRRLSQNYSRTWVDVGIVDGETYAVPATATSKSVFWYRPDAFEAMGLTVPKTWEQLLSVTKRIKAGGETPWALGAQDSWTLTDWFENIYLRTAGPANYSELFAGRLRFDHASVIAALERMTTILNDRYVAGSLSGALKTDFFEGMFLVFGVDPSAHLYMEGGFVGSLALQYTKPKPKPGRTIDLAAFPTIDPSFGSPLVGGVNLAAAFDDNDALRELLLFLSSREAGRVWASTGALISPNKRVPPRAYPNALLRAEAQQLADATVFVADGSDSLPGSLGQAWGATLQKVIQQPRDIPKLVKDFQDKSAREFKQ